MSIGLDITKVIGEKKLRKTKFFQRQKFLIASD